MDKWIPSQKQQSGIISKTFDFFNEELAELQEKLNCPDEFLEVVKNYLTP